MFLSCLFGTFWHQLRMTDQFRNMGLRESLRILIKKQLFLFIPVVRLCEIRGVMELDRYDTGNMKLLLDWLFFSKL